MKIGMIVAVADEVAAMLKKIGTESRKDIEAFFGCKVDLKLWVKVKEDWRNRAGLIRDFGLDNK